MSHEGGIKLFLHSTEKNRVYHNHSRIIPLTSKQVHIIYNIGTNMSQSENINANIEDPFVFTDEGFQDLILPEPMKKKSSRLSKPWKESVLYQGDFSFNCTSTTEDEHKSPLGPTCISLESLSLHPIPSSIKPRTLKRVNAHHEFHILYGDSREDNHKTNKERKRSQNSSFSHNSYRENEIWDQFIDIDAPQLIKRPRFVY